MEMSWLFGLFAKKKARTDSYTSRAPRPDHLQRRLIFLISAIVEGLDGEWGGGGTLTFLCKNRRKRSFLRVFIAFCFIVNHKDGDRLSATTSS